MVIEAGIARDATLKLLFMHAPGSTICPSEVARMLASTAPSGAAADWREALPAVHAAVDILVSDGLVQLSWKGKELAARAGPYRIGRRAHD